MKIPSRSVALLGLLIFIPVAVARGQNSETYRALNLFGDVFERVRAEYVEKVSDEDLIESAVNGMLSSLDPHSSYMNRKSFQDMQVQTRGQFGGLGLEVSQENGIVKVVSPIDDTPAFRAGIQAGEYVTHINGEPVTGLSLNEAVDKMRGPVGSDIKLTLRRTLTSEPRDVTLTRAEIRIQSVRSRVEQDSVGYVRISSFNEQTTGGLERAVQKIREQLQDRLLGFVIDLRNNPGGLLDQAVTVSDDFLNQGEIVSTRGRNAEEGQRFFAKTGDITEGLPLVVLINGGSASASEIVAGALQDHRRAVILGTQSFGKGSVQTIIPLPGHGAIRLTTARYYTPSGRSIQQLGITPDITVQPARLTEIETTGGRREADLKGALRNDTAAGSNNRVGGQSQQPPTSGGDAAPAAPGGEAAATTPPESPPFDYQLARAVDLIRGLHLFSQRAGN